MADQVEGAKCSRRSPIMDEGGGEEEGLICTQRSSNNITISSSLQFPSQSRVLYLPTHTHTQYSHRNPLTSPPFIAPLPEISVLFKEEKVSKICDESYGFKWNGLDIEIVWKEMYVGFKLYGFHRIRDSLPPHSFDFSEKERRKTSFQELSKIEDSLSSDELQMALNGHVVLYIFEWQETAFEINGVLLKEVTHRHEMYFVRQGVGGGGLSLGYGPVSLTPFFLFDSSLPSSNMDYLNQMA
ncbi:hypothetical protein HAX54_024153, partial [Datura stramonium]|nr:hypothetical protein [Datura stramonium]